MSTRLSVVVPCFNEAPCIVPFVKAIDAQGLDCGLEYVFVDDGSSDGTLEEIRRIADGDPRIHYISFSRNFGKESALLAGLRKATGELVVTMDADLQHSPSVLPSMVAGILDEGYDCVAARRTTRTGESPLRSWFAHRFYWLMNRFSEVHVEDGSMDYRMMSRNVVKAVLSMGEVNRFTKGIYQWVGFRTKWIEVENVKRDVGTTKWSFWGLCAYSVKGILAFSTAPLQIASLVGMMCCLLSFSYMGVIFAKWLLCGDPVAGWPTIMCVILLLGGLQLFAIGIVGTYLAGVYREVKNRPPYIVKESR